MRYDRYGPPDILRLRDVEAPPVNEQDVLVRVAAASVNPLDFHHLRGTPYLLRLSEGLRRPRTDSLGVDLAGTVEAVGAAVTGLRPGDEVFGTASGTLAEYIAVRQDGVLLRKPANLTFVQAAAVPVAAFTALQALRDKGRVRPGYRVLVNGASGGVGTFAVQLAKAFGAEVTAVCGTGKVELTRSIGADHVVDYTRTDYTRTAQRYDLMLDIAGNRSPARNRRLLTGDGVLVWVGGPDRSRWLGPAASLARTLGYGLFVRHRIMSVTARPNRDDLALLRDLLEAGTVVPVIDRTYPLTEVPQAIRYLEAGHAKGKIVVTV